MRVVISCEHGGNRIPSAYWPLFKRHRALLQTHRGFDPGALAHARDFAKAFDAELVYSTTSRLLVELNRSPKHRDVFSEVTRPLPLEEREKLLERYYRPYRIWLESQVREAVEAGECVLHISSHSFTPKLQGEVRRADVGLLYDPHRTPELRFCKAWQRELSETVPAAVVRRNYPYRGYSDGLTTYLRRLFPQERYAGVEIEVNQKLTHGDPRAWHDMRKHTVSAAVRAAPETF